MAVVANGNKLGCAKDQPGLFRFSQAGLGHRGEVIRRCRVAYPAAGIGLDVGDSKGSTPVGCHNDRIEVIGNGLKAGLQPVRHAFGPTDGNFGIEIGLEFTVRRHVPDIAHRLALQTAGLGRILSEDVYHIPFRDTTFVIRLIGIRYNLGNAIGTRRAVRFREGGRNEADTVPPF